MEKAVAFRTIMNGPYRDHPTEEALERFLLNQSEEDELEIVETHVLACEACVTRLETLEFNIQATKVACRDLLVEQAAKLAEPLIPSPIHAFKRWLSWSSLPRLSLTGGSLAACALTLTFLSLPRQVNLTAYRGADTNTVAQWLPLDLHLNASELPPGPVNVEVVNAQGGKIWHGAATIRNDQINVRIPRLTTAGSYLIRISSAQDDASAELLREFSIQAKSPF